MGGDRSFQSLFEIVLPAAIFDAMNFAYRRINREYSLNYEKNITDYIYYWVYKKLPNGILDDWKENYLKKNLAKKAVTPEKLYLHAHIAWSTSFTRFVAIFLAPFLKYIFLSQKLEFSGFGYTQMDKDTNSSEYIYAFQSAMIQFVVFVIAEFYCLLFEIGKERQAEMEARKSRGFNSSASVINEDVKSPISYIWETRIKYWGFTLFLDLFNWKSKSNNELVMCPDCARDKKLFGNDKNEKERTMKPERRVHVRFMIVVSEILIAM